MKLLSLFKRKRAAGSSVVTDEDIAHSEEVTERVTEEMERMRSQTEDASLNIGQLLQRIVNTATEGNSVIKESIQSAVGDSDDGGNPGQGSLAEAVAKPTECVSSFASKTREFFDRYMEVSEQANVACQSIEESACEVARLTRTSKLLSLNLRVEASRLGSDGRCFDALGQEVQDFSRSVEGAAEQIRRSAAVFLSTVPQMHRDAIAIREELGKVSVEFDSDMEHVTERAEVVTESLRSTLDQVETRNNQILDFSNQTLSHLAFQDPVSQGLQRMQHDFQQMHRMVCGDVPDFQSLSQLQEEVGDDGSIFRETGTVELF